MLAHEQYMLGKAYTGLSKDVRGSIADIDLVAIVIDIFGECRVS
jgi:hypothetical protein